MQKITPIFQSNYCDRPISRLPRLAALIQTTATPPIKLHPVRGLFENTMQGYHSSPLSTQSATSILQNSALIIYITNIVDQFLADKEQDHLFISIALPILLSHAFNTQLTSLMQRTPGLFGRLVLLLQENDLYPDSFHEKAIPLINNNLSNIGIRLGIQTNSPTCLHSNHLNALSSLCVLINYSDDWVYHPPLLDELNTIIRYCRSKGWLLLVDYHQRDSRPTS